jgi:hypothetical protein
MKFWKTLRWLAALAFIAIFAVSWLGIGHEGASNKSRDPAPRSAPTIN